MYLRASSYITVLYLSNVVTDIESDTLSQLSSHFHGFVTLHNVY